MARVGNDQERLWVQGAQSGDQEAFRALVEAYTKPIYNLAYRMLGSSAEAEDATQEAFVRVYTRLETYDSGRKFSSWILSVASHYCIDRLRRRKAYIVSMDEIGSDRWVPDSAPRPEEQLVDSEREAHVRRILATLPPQYRLVIVLRYWHDMSYEEISEITDSTISAVKSRLHRARKAMADALDQDPAGQRAVQPVSRRINDHVVSESF